MLSRQGSSPLTCSSTVVIASANSVALTCASGRAVADGRPSPAIDVGPSAVASAPSTRIALGSGAADAVVRPLAVPGAVRAQASSATCSVATAAGGISSDVADARCLL